jgi:ABC-type glutathione transport system ATPase component
MAAELAKPLLEVRGLSKSFTRRRWLWGKPVTTHALRSIDLTVAAGKHVAIVGESGSGKSTLALCVPRLEECDSGSIVFDGQEVRALHGAALAAARRQMQVVFQDSANALNPRFSALEIAEEPLLIAGVSRAARVEKARAMLEQVGIAASSVERKAWEFSGGQRQRLAIARALVLEPKLLLLDEVFSGLDLLVQAQVVDLLRRLQSMTACTYIYISHDLALMERLAEEILVMYRGEIVERGAPAALVARAQHPHTQALLSANAVLSAAFRAQAVGAS